MMRPLDHELDNVRALGHGAVALINLGLLLAIVAVVLSGKAGTADMVRAFFTFLAWLVGQVVKPISGGSVVNLGSTLKTAGTHGMTATTGGGIISPAYADPAPAGEPGGASVLYPITSNVGGVEMVTGASVDPLYPGQHPYTGIKPDGSPIYAP